MIPIIDLRSDNNISITGDERSLKSLLELYYKLGKTN